MRQLLVHRHKSTCTPLASHTGIEEVSDCLLVARRAAGYFFFRREAGRADFEAAFGAAAGSDPRVS